MWIVCQDAVTVRGDCGVKDVHDIVMHGADEAPTVLHTEQKKQETQRPH